MQNFLSGIDGNVDEGSSMPQILSTRYPFMAQVSWYGCLFMPFVTACAGGGTGHAGHAGHGGQVTFTSDSFTKPSLLQLLSNN